MILQKYFAAAHSAPGEYFTKSSDLRLLYPKILFAAIKFLIKFHCFVN